MLTRLLAARHHLSDLSPRSSQPQHSEMLLHNLSLTWQELLGLGLGLAVELLLVPDGDRRAARPGDLLNIISRRSTSCINLKVQATQPRSRRRRGRAPPVATVETEVRAEVAALQLSLDEVLAIPARRRRRFGTPASARRDALRGGRAARDARPQRHPPRGAGQGTAGGPLVSADDAWSRACGLDGRWPVERFPRRACERGHVLGEAPFALTVGGDERLLRRRERAATCF